MERREITCQKEQGVAVININAAPRDGDELTSLGDALAEVCADIASESGINVVIVTGEKDVFDIGTLQDRTVAVREEGAESRSITASISRLDCPVVAAIQGQVSGQGLELALACDIRFATERSSFCLPQLPAGSIPGDGGTQRLPRIVGKSMALELILTGRPIDGKEAHRIGLVNRLISPDELMSVTMDVARAMALQAPLGIRYAKEAICQGMEMNIHQGLRLEADLYFLLHTTRDRREGIEAFRDKRKPEFEGR